jgi:hypothetical protein
MSPLKNLKPDERERFDYLQLVFEEEFEQAHLTYHVSGILVYELLNLLAACAHLFDEFDFPDNEDSRLLRYAVTGAIADYMEGDDHAI